MKLRPIVAGCLADLAVLCGCEPAAAPSVSDAITPGAEQHVSQSALGAPPSTFHNFGEVSLEHGSVLLEHEFVVWNRSEQTVQISKVTTSCGCVAAVVDTTELQPGSTASLRVSVDVSGVGFTQQSATVVFSNGMTTEYAMQAVGTRESQLYIAPARARVSSKASTIRIVLQVLNRAGEEERKEPQARIADEILPIRFEGWTVLEARNEVTGRPLRQTGTIEMDLSNYDGAYPLLVNFSTATGLSGIVTVDFIDQ